MLISELFILIIDIIVPAYKVAQSPDGAGDCRRPVWSWWPGSPDLPPRVTLVTSGWSLSVSGQGSVVSGGHKVARCRHTLYITCDGPGSNVGTGSGLRLQSGLISIILIITDIKHQIDSY